MDKTQFEGDPMKFRAWAQNILGKLLEENCQLYAVQNMPAPVEPADFHLPPMAAAAFPRWTHSTTQYIKDKRYWDDKVAKAYGTIYLGLSEVLRIGIDTVALRGKPFETWSYLNTTYGTANITGARLELHRTIFRNLEMKEDEDMINFLFKYKQLATDAQIVGDSELIFQICKEGVLPSKFEHICQTIIVDGGTWNQCQSKLLLIDSRFQNAKLERLAVGDRPPGKALLVGKARRENGRDDRRFTLLEEKKDLRNASFYGKCFQCGNIHKFWDCICRNCPTCGKFDVHVPTSCPRLSNERRTEWENFKNQRSKGSNNGGSQGGNPRQGNSLALKMPNRNVNLVTGASEHLRGQPDVPTEGDDKGEDWADFEESEDEVPDSNHSKGYLNQVSLSSFVLNRPEEVKRIDSSLLKGHIFMLSSRKRKAANNLFYLDSGAAVHCALDYSMLVEVKVLDTVLSAANDSPIAVTHIGNVNEVIVGVHVTPSLSTCLLSENALRKKGMWVFNLPTLPSSGEFISAYICDAFGRVVFCVDQDKMVDVSSPGTDLCVEIPEVKKIPRVAAASIRRAKSQIDSKGLSDFVFYLHQCLGHPSLTTMCYMADHLTMSDFPLSSTQLRKHWTECIACWKGKSHRRVPHQRVFPEPEEKNSQSSTIPAIDSAPKEAADKVPEQIGFRICSDIFGPLPLATAGRKYVITFTDATSGFIMLGTAKNKTFLFNSVKHVIQEYAAAGHHRPTYEEPMNILQSDAEQIYKSAEMAELLRSQGIRQQWSAPHTHEQNGTAERMHRWLGECLATFFSDSS